MPTNVHTVLITIKNSLEFKSQREFVMAFVAGLVERFGALYVYIGAGLALLLTLGSTIAICSKSKTNFCVYRSKARLTQMVFWSLFLRTALNSYIFMAVAAKLGSMFEKDGYLEENQVNWPCVAFLAFMPYFSFTLLFYTEKNELDMTVTKQKVGSIYTGLKTETMYTLMQPMVFYLRRLCFVMALQSTIFPIQWGGMIWCVMFQIIYYLDAKPYAEKSMKVTEIVNEMVLLLLVYVLPTFGDFIPNDIYKMANYRFGWVFLAILSPLFLFNTVMIFIETVVICLEKKRI